VRIVLLFHSANNVHKKKVQIMYYSIKRNDMRIAILW